MRFVTLSSPATDQLKDIHIVPKGEWKGHQGGAFKIGDKEISEIMDNFQRFGINLVVDYEHQTVFSQDNGQKAPAAGWIKTLEVREDGIWAKDVEWTDSAKTMLSNKEYKYISPVLVFDAKDPVTKGSIGVYVHSVALTNTPFFRDNLKPIWAKDLTDNKQEETNQMDELKAKIAELEKLITAKDARIKELETSGKNESLEAQLKAANEQLAENKAEQSVTAAIDKKLILPAQKDFAKKMAMKDPEMFQEYLKGLTPHNLDQEKKVEGGQGSDSKMTFSALVKDPAKLKEVMEKNPEQYKALYNKFIEGGE